MEKLKKAHNPPEGTFGLGELSTSLGTGLVWVGQTGPRSPQGHSQHQTAVPWGGQGGCSCSEELCQADRAVSPQGEGSRAGWSPGALQAPCPVRERRADVRAEDAAHRHHRGPAPAPRPPQVAQPCLPPCLTLQEPRKGFLSSWSLKHHPELGHSPCPPSTLQAAVLRSSEHFTPTFATQQQRKTSVLPKLPSNPAPLLPLPPSSTHPAGATLPKVLEAEPWPG